MNFLSGSCQPCRVPRATVPRVAVMKHVTYSDKNLMVGDAAADALIAYATALAIARTADSVQINALGTEGEPVVATFLLDTGAPLMVETSPSTLDEPDNDEATAYMIQRTEQLTSPKSVSPEDPAASDDIQHLDFM